MNEIINFIMSEFGYLISEDKNGELYTYEELIDKLDCSQEEKRLIKSIFLNKNVVIRTTKKEEKEEVIERSPLVRDLNYGDAKSHEYESIDRPVIAKIEFEDEQIVYEDYEELDSFIINEFIPNKVILKVNKSKNAKSYIENKPYLSIRLCDITELKLSDLEIKHICELITSEGIRIAGTSQDLENVVLDYDYVNTHKSFNFEEPFSKEEQREKLIEYYNNGNRKINTELEEEIILRNMNLVLTEASKIAYRHNMNVEELITSGYEGMLYSLRRFDPYYSTEFSTYAIWGIRSYINKDIAKQKNIIPSFYPAFHSACAVVEREWGKKFDGDIEMLDEIFELLESQRVIPSETLKSYYNLIANSTSLEQMIEDENDTYEDQIEIDKSIIQGDLKSSIKEALGRLNPKEAEILRLRFGLDGHNILTLEQVGNIFGVKRERIRQQEAKALRKLRHPSITQNLRQFL